MPEVHKIAITPTTLANLAQALDYRYRIRGREYDEDGIDLMDTMGILYKELATQHAKVIYGPLTVKLAGAPDTADLTDALLTIEQFGFLPLLQVDESHLDNNNKEN